MREIFAFDRISDQRMERAPIPEHSRSDWLLESGDLLFARQSLTLAGAGKVSLVLVPPEPMTFESHIIRVRLDSTVADSLFYYYLFRSTVGRDLIESIVEQVAAAGIRASDLGRLRVPVPEIEEQRRIAGVLSAIDELIDTNRQLAAALRLQRWAYTEHLLIGGEPTDLGSVADLVRETVSPVTVAPDTSYLGLEHFAVDGGGITGSGQAGGLDSLKSRFEAGDVLYGKLRPYFRKVDRPARSGICSTEIWVIRAKTPEMQHVVERVVSSEAFTTHATSASEGTRMPRANWRHCSQFGLTMPPTAELQDHDKRARGLYDMEWELRAEADQLANARDELLPFLMSGQITVNEAWEAAS